MTSFKGPAARDATAGVALAVPRVAGWGGPIMPALLFGIITQSEHKA